MVIVCKHKVSKLLEPSVYSTMGLTRLRTLRWDGLASVTNRFRMAIGNSGGVLVIFGMQLAMAGL
jgi:hypothetical protein